MEVAKALGGSFKLVTPAPKPVREMTQLLREKQKDGDTQTNYYKLKLTILHYTTLIAMFCSNMAAEIANLLL